MHWLVVLAIVLVLFGAGKLPRVMGDFAKGIKAFKSGMKETRTRPPRATPHQQVPPPAGTAAAAAAGNSARLSPTGAAISASETPTAADGKTSGGRSGGAHARARDGLRPVANDRLEIRNDPAKGRGVFARAPIAAGSADRGRAGHHRAGRAVRAARSDDPARLLLSSGTTTGRRRPRRGRARAGGAVQSFAPAQRARAAQSARARRSICWR